MLQNLVLQVVEPCITGDCGLELGGSEPEDVCYATDWEYKTIYEGGMLTLNSKGPWLDKGMLKAKGDLHATNYSKTDENGNLHFCMVITGEFRNAPYSFTALAEFDGSIQEYQFKQDDEGKPVFQRGYDFDAMIEILP